MYTVVKATIYKRGAKIHLKSTSTINKEPTCWTSVAIRREVWTERGQQIIDVVRYLPAINTLCTLQVEHRLLVKINLIWKQKFLKVSEIEWKSSYSLVLLLHVKKFWLLIKLEQHSPKIYPTTSVTYSPQNGQCGLIIAKFLFVSLETLDIFYFKFKADNSE